MSIPLRYMHTPTELADLADAACSRLLAAFAGRLDADASFKR